MPYFGRWPEWFELYLSSCARNPTIDWIFFTDCGRPTTYPPNVSFVPMTWPGCLALLREVCPSLDLSAKPYKICDFRFAFGDIFKSSILGYDFFAFGDIDVIYGDLRAFLPPEVFQHDLITFNGSHVSGHLTLIRSRPDLVDRYQHIAAWRKGASAPENQQLDERLGYYGIENVYAIESFNTPLSPYVAWTNGGFLFPYVWYYREGNLFTNVDGGRPFMYLHFMRYKSLWRSQGRRRILHFEEYSFGSDWKLLPSGFHPYQPGDETAERNRTIAVFGPNTPRKHRILG